LLLLLLPLFFVLPASGTAYASGSGYSYDAPLVAPSLTVLGKLRVQGQNVMDLLLPLVEQMAALQTQVTTLQAANVSTQATVADLTARVTADKVIIGELQGALVDAQTNLTTMQQ